MKVSISSFSRRMTLQDASGESLGASSHEGLSAKLALSQTFCRSYTCASPKMQAQSYKPFLADTWSIAITLYVLPLGCILLMGCCQEQSKQHSVSNE